MAWLAAQISRRLGGQQGLSSKIKRPDQRVGLPHKTPEHDLGDELEMLRRRGIPVISSPDRIAGARLAQQHGAQLIFMDDSYQNRSLARNLGHRLH